ncbi:MAG: two-component regulator propeller domain-containing protein [Chitinophagaceae bacterium]
MMIKRIEKKITASRSLIAPLLVTGILLFMSACLQHKKPSAYPKVQENAFTAPQVTVLSQLADSNKPKVVLLDNVPKPVITNVPIRNSIINPGVGNGGKKVIQKQPGQDFLDNDTSNKPIVYDAAGKGFFTTYTTDQGLSLDQVYCSYKDKWGNLWFGTNGGGVSKYDGKNFITYTTAHGLSNNIVWCITQDHKGNLWFGTDGSGVTKYDGERFTNYSKAQGLPDNVIFSIAEDKKNNLWFGTLKGGVSKYDGEHFTSYSTQNGLANNAVKNIFEDSKGNFWFATLGGGVSKYDGINFTNYTTKEGLAENSVWSIAEDTAGNLWFGTESRGVSKYDGKIFTNYIAFSMLSDDAVLCIISDKRGALWFGTLKSGVIKYDSNFFTKYSTSNGLANNEVRTIIDDQKGNLWFGSFGGGVSKFAGNSFTNFTTAQGLPGNVVFSMAEDNYGNLWLGTSSGGVSRYDGKRFTNFTKADGLSSNEVYCVSKDNKGNLWVGTAGGGASKYDGKSFTNYTTLQGLANDIVFSIVEDKKGNLWFGTSGGGVSMYNGKSFTNYTVSQGLANNVVFSIREDKNANLWFGTLGGGVSKFDGNSFTNYTVAQGLSDNVVWAITEDKPGNLWFGTQHGLSVMPNAIVVQGPRNNKTSESGLGHLFTSFTTEDGLPDNFITQIVQGDSEKLYVGTNLGMCELLPGKHGNAVEKNWSVGRVLNTKNGYPVKDVNAGLKAMFQDSKGIIWIGTGSDKTGLARFDPLALINNNDVPPAVVINEVKINNENVCWRDLYLSGEKERTDSNTVAATIIAEVSTYGRQLSDSERDSIRSKFANIIFDSITRWQPLPRGLVLPYYFNNIGFDFSAIETGKNFLVNYTYFLEGYDKDWSPASSNTFVNFGNIREGSYTFMVKAQSPDGVWSQPVSYNFKVLPPWWRTWWMFVVYAILVVSSVLLFYWWKHRRIIYQKKVLEHKVAVATKQVREENKKVQAQKEKIEDTLKELKETQSQLIQSEKMASLGELTAGIAHEIQNPLNFVNNFSEVNTELIDEMKQELHNGNINEVEGIADDIKDNEQKINHHGRRADAIVKGMLQHSRNNAGQKEPTNINALADEYFRLSYHGLRAKDNNFNASMQTNFDESIGNINIIPQDIGRVLLNLFTNAFYAVTEKKKQHPEGYDPTVSVSTKKINGKVEVHVIDNGNGIPQKVLDKIFQPFFTTKPTGQGTGLGLSLSYDIIKAHGGEIKVETKEGEGTEFIIELQGKNISA